MDYHLLGDYHLHTRYSDGTGEIDDVVERAVALGLAEIGITDHLVPPGLGTVGEYGVAPSLLERYVADVEDAADRHPEITVLLGVEADYLPEREDWLAEALAAHPFDYALGSVHFVGDFDFAGDDDKRRDSRWDDVDAVYRDYYAVVERAARSGLFAVLAHFDYVSLWGHRPAADVTRWEDRALAAVAAAGMALELNTGGVLDPAGAMYPSPRQLARARELGIPLVFGSDAHELGDIGMLFEEGVAAARAAGYTETLRLSDRTPVPLP